MLTSLKETEPREISSSKSPAQASPVILNHKSYAKNSRDNLIDKIQMHAVNEDTNTYRREQKSTEQNYIECTRPLSPPQLTKTVV